MKRALVNKFKILLIFICLITVGYLNAQNKEYYDVLYLNVVYDEKTVKLNNKESLNLDLIDISPALTIGGDFKIEYFNKNGYIWNIPIDLKIGVNELYIPYLVNAEYLIFKDKSDNFLGKIDISVFNICNENNICEAGEENLCPLDCPSANNPNYPLTVFEKGFTVPYKKIEEKIKPQKEIKELQIVTQTPILPEKSFSYISLITAIVFLVFLIFGIIIYLKFKK
jgi:hypothetical protein